MNYKGQYSDQLMYVVGDVVTIGGSSYACRKMTSGEFPTASSSWTLIAAGGATGATGADGRSGKDGENGVGIPSNGEEGEVLVKLGSSPYECRWSRIDAATIGAANRAHLHAMYDVSGLESALNQKAESSHQHGIDDIATLKQQLDSKAMMQHQHLASDIVSGTIDVDQVIADSVNVGSVIISDQSISGSDRMSISLDGVDRVSMVNDEVHISGNAIISRLTITSGANISSSSQTGKRGDIVIGSDYIFVCVSDNKWKRTPLQEW
jgi:hypothetical protein